MKTIPEVEGKVSLTYKGFHGTYIERRKEVLPCYENHVKDGVECMSEDVLVIAETLAWCDCGKIYQRKECFLEGDPENGTRPDDWELLVELQD